MPVGRLNL
jgi:hypothetical protein